MKNHQFDLVKNTYPAHEAKEVLISLISDKIKFLTCKIFSLEERFGKAPTHLRERLTELKSEKSRLIETLDSFDDQNQLVEIDCQVVFSVKDGKGNDSALYQATSSSLS